MDIQKVASELRGSRRKRPSTSREGCSQDSVDRIRSAVASKWIASVAASPRIAPRRPQSSPTGRTYCGGESSAPLWARGNPCANPFPRARTWTRKGHVQGLSGTRPPAGWNQEAERLEAVIAERQKHVSAKDVYYKLVHAAALEREKRTVPTPAFLTGITRSGGSRKICLHDNHAEQHLPQNEPLGIAEESLSMPNSQEAVGNNMRHREQLPRKMEINVNICPKDEAAKGDERAQNQPQQGHQRYSKIEAIPDVDDDSATKCCLPPDDSQPAATLCTQPPTLDDATRHTSKMAGGIGGAPFTRRTGEEVVRTSMCRSTSVSGRSDSSGSSASSEDRNSCYDGESDDYATGILEDYTEGVDTWLEDVHGAGREAFFELFKHDATPQFCRPSLDVIGRHGIGSNFVDGNPNIKYLPQRPVELHEISSSQPPPAPQSATIAVRRRDAAPVARASLAQETPPTASEAMGTAFESTVAHSKGQEPLAPNLQSLRPKVRQTGQTATEKRNERCEVRGEPPTTIGIARGRPHSSAIIRGGFSVGSGEGTSPEPSSIRLSPTTSPTRLKMSNRTVVRCGSAKAEESKPKHSRLKRPQTADGRDIEATKHKNPRLDDPGDPVMIAHRMMKRPLSPRRDYLMRCAERQLMPLPVINRALRIDSSTVRNDRSMGETDQNHATVEDGVEDVKEVDAKGERDIKKGIHEGCIVLRHYYLGSARAKCLESAITSIRVALREVELVDSCLDGQASEALLEVLLTRVGTIRKLDLSRNRIGVKGAAGLARFITNKDCNLRFLNLNGNKAGDQAITAVLKALVRWQPPLSYLGLSDNRLTLKTMQDCAGPLLTGGLSLLTLDLGWNHLNQSAVEELSDALAWNKSITKMSLEFNNSGEGIHSLAGALLNNKTLTSLDLTANQARCFVRWRGAIALSEAIGTSSSIRSLTLRENPIGTAAGLQMGITLARKLGTACRVDVKGCTCFSDKTDVWSGLNARMRAARAARTALVRARNAGIRARKKAKTQKNDKRSSPVAGRSPAPDVGVGGSGSKKMPIVKNTPPPLPPHTRPDEQLFWLDLTIDKKWELKLSRPFDRAIAGEVIRTFNFSAGGSLSGIHRAAGEPSRRLVFRRRERLLNSSEAKTAKEAVSAAASFKSCLFHDQAGATAAKMSLLDRRGDMRNRGKGKPRLKEPDHPLAIWLREWTERKERGWDGDVAPVAGLSLREECDRLLAQASNIPIPLRALPGEGTLQLTYTAGKPISPKQSLLLEGDPEGAASATSPPTSNASGQSWPIRPRQRQQAGATSEQPSTASENTGGVEGDESARIAGGGAHSTTNAGAGVGLGSSLDSGGAVSGGSGSVPDTGFEAMMFMLRSLGSPTQMCEMVECLSRRTWLTDDQLCIVLNAFSDEPRMSEPRCRVFLALLPNIRHNRLRVLARHLSQRVKRLQGIPPPQPAAQPTKRVTAAAARARAREEAAAQLERSQALLWQDLGNGTAAETEGEKRGKAEEAEANRRRAEVMNDGWREGPLFQNLGGGVDDENDVMVLGLLAGCSTSTFQRFGLSGCLTPLEAARLGRVVEGSAYFNPFAPQGHYNLDMSIPADRDNFRALLSLDKVNRAYVGMKGLLDPSQHGNGHHFRNFRLGGGRPVKFGLLSRSRARTKFNKRMTKNSTKKGGSKMKKPPPTAHTASKGPPAKLKATSKQTSAGPGGKGTKRAKVAASHAKKKTAPDTDTKKPAIRGRLPGAPGGSVKRYPTMPSVSRISFDFLHYIRPSGEATPVPEESFEQLMHLLTRFAVREVDTNESSLENANGGGAADDASVGRDHRDVHNGNTDPRHEQQAAIRTRNWLAVNLLRNLCHVFYFDCNQVIGILNIFPGEDSRGQFQRKSAPEDGEHVSAARKQKYEENGSSCREEAFVATFSRITDESNLDLCLGLLTDQEMARCEARLGPVALFMPTQPDGEYKLDLRDFGDRQIVTLLLELQRKDPTLQLLGMRHDGKYLEEGSATWASGVPKRGRFRTRSAGLERFQMSTYVSVSPYVRTVLLGAIGRIGPTASSKLAATHLPRDERRAMRAASDRKPAMPSGVQAGAYESAPQGLGDRPRKRAVVRVSRKNKGVTTKRKLTPVTRRPRAQSWSHLPRPRFLQDEAIEH
ncbi:unnamed protein product, partial [Scytosiphon promiscuus]